MNQEHLDKALMELENNRDFQLVVEWFKELKNNAVSQLAEVQPSEKLQQLSGRLMAMMFIINEIKEKQSRE